MINAAAADSTCAEQAVAGEREATRVVRCAVDGFARPDEFLHSLQDVTEADGHRLPTSPRLRAWCRAIQKSIERGAAG
jgi:hypothetical protein